MPNIHTAKLHDEQPTGSVARAGEAFASACRLARRYDGSRSLAALLLGTVIAALILAADKLIGSWAQALVVAGWISVWVAALVVMGLFVFNLRRMLMQLGARLDAWSARVARTRADQRLWAMAQSDARLMANLRAAHRLPQAVALHSMPTA